ncbi:hypothetical protein YC2023_034709 [Brassica napus]
MREGRGNMLHRSVISGFEYLKSLDTLTLPNVTTTHTHDQKRKLRDAAANARDVYLNFLMPFGTLYDPYSEGADFVRGYPCSFRSGVPCAASCGLWRNLADLDAPTQALKTGERNTSYVDAVMTVPLKAMLPISGINVAFNRELM